MRIVWLSSVQFSAEKIKQTGTWLQPLASSISSIKDYEVINISIGNTPIIKEEAIGKLRQFVLPATGKNKENKENIISLKDKLNSVIRSLSPDVIHVWGTETIWANMNITSLFKDIPVLIDIQGLYHRYWEYFYNGLTPLELAKCIYIKELIRPKLSIFASRKEYKRLGDEEIKNLHTFKHISYQSLWVKEQLELLSLDAQLYPTKIILRNSFYGSIWKKPANGNSPVIFTISSGAIPYKGFHVLLKALSVIKKQIPDVKLRIAGRFLPNSKIDNGYPHYIKGLLKEFEIENNVFFIGALDEDHIVNELLSSDVCVIPSFIETYCLAFAEAMLVGCPTVAAFSGSLPNLADNNKETMFYSPTDYPDCAAKVLTLLRDDELSHSISSNARKRRLQENDVNTVTARQIDIYRRVIEYSNK